MKDRYLYRAKRIDNGEWVEGYLYRLSENHPPFIMLSDRRGESHEVDPSTICQCTGLKDKNGELIWENDVCKYYNPEDKNGIAIITEDYASWISGTIRQTEIMTPMFYLKCGEEWEVIGNIFDNPELLEVGECLN
ncbi:MAG: YopX family protein [Lachnospiraceae bacterium]